MTLWPWLLAFALIALADVVYLLWYFRWEMRRTAGVSYYGQPSAGRLALKRQIRRLSIPAMPAAFALAPFARRPDGLPSFEYEGVHGPVNVSSAKIFARAKAYRPRPEDVFVATQMRCGTTWMQQVVYQIVTSGKGEFADDGLRHLYNASPWIDAANSVSVDAAPLLGQPPLRIIKTHLPVDLCPYSPQAKYIYVARHPVSCFASIVDFNRTMLGPFVPSMQVLVDWYCSDRMYWLPWPRHVDGWWAWSEQRPNVLFAHYEEMVHDFGGVLDRVAKFLGHSLNDEARARITERCSFSYMKTREDVFEMAPPTMFSVTGGRFFSSGKANRDADLAPAIRERILTYCRTSLAGAAYPAARFYGDLT